MECRYRVNHLDTKNEERKKEGTGVRKAKTRRGARNERWGTSSRRSSLHSLEPLKHATCSALCFPASSASKSAPPRNSTRHTSCPAGSDNRELQSSSSQIISVMVG
eukprot:3935819-Rhodomonas_salina.3